MEPARYTG